MPAPAPILFYDGTRGLCARTVRWTLEHDRRGTLKFAPLQGKTYAALDIPDKPGELGTVVLLDDRGLHVRSEAVARLLGHLGGVWPLIGAIGRAVPRPAREALYRFVARHRLAWFGEADACALASDTDRARFLP